MLDPIHHTITVPCNSQKAFDVFVRDMPGWWPLDKRSMSMMNAKEPPKELRVEARLGGTIVEASHDGTEYLWGTFTRYEPYTAVAMDFHMGLPKENASLVEVDFEEVDASHTRVRLTHSNWEAFGDLAEAMRGGYGSSWGLIFDQAYMRACGGKPETEPAVS